MNSNTFFSSQNALKDQAPFKNRVKNQHGALKFIIH